MKTNLPSQRWECMCGRHFRMARKCLRCGDDLPWLVYRGEISFAKRRQMTVTEYVAWRASRPSQQLIEAKTAEARLKLLEWINGG